MADFLCVIGRGYNDIFGLFLGAGQDRGPLPGGGAVKLFVLRYDQFLHSLAIFCTYLSPCKLLGVFEHLKENIYI